jgi:uncharacterized protein
MRGFVQATSDRYRTAGLFYPLAAYLFDFTGQWGLLTQAAAPVGPLNQTRKAFISGPASLLSQLSGGFMDSINSRIAEELGVRPQQVEAAVALLDEGSTVPFIARYRKEVTGSLDDTQLRHLEERLRYLRELDERRISILASIEEQGKLTPHWNATSSSPTPRPASKTFTCRTSRSAAPRARSPWKPASASWPTACSTTRP